MPFGLCRLFGSGCLAGVFKFVLAGRVVFKQSGAKHSRAFWGQGGQKWRFGQFYEICNFRHENSLRQIIVHLMAEKQKSGMFYLIWRTRFDNYQLKSQTWKSMRFSVQTCKFVKCSNRWILHMKWVLWVSWMNPECENDQDWSRNQWKG